MTCTCYHSNVAIPLPGIPSYFLEIGFLRLIFLNFLSALLCTVTKLSMITGYECCVDKPRLHTSFLYAHFNKRNTLPWRVLIYILKCICVIRIHVVTSGNPTSPTTTTLTTTDPGAATPTLNGKLKSVSCVMKIFVKYSNYIFRKFASARLSRFEPLSVISTKISFAHFKKVLK